MATAFEPATVPTVPERVTLAVDTEFEGTNTLVVQFAMRDPHGRVILQIYHAPTIPPPDDAAAGLGIPASILGLTGPVVVRPPRPLSPALSPALVLIDLLGLPNMAVGRRNSVSRTTAQLAGAVEVTLVGHFLPADLLRAFGRGFWAAGLTDTLGTPGLRLKQFGKLLRLVEPGPAGRYRPPVVEYLRPAAGPCTPVRVTTLDTQLTFGGGSLDSLAQSFLGVGKLPGITRADKAQMRSVFRERPEEAYAYAAADAVLTLLLAERMGEVDRSLYASFGLQEYAPDRLKPTLGSRASATLRAAAYRSAEGSKTLSTAGKVCRRKVDRLFKSGGGTEVARESMFGGQTADVHGGLTLSRSPARLSDTAPGQLRDVDLRGCYPSVLAQMDLYLGKPVLLEPGRRGLKLAEAVAMAESSAAGWDAWFVKATGNISSGGNTLVASTADAQTHSNARRPRPDRKRRGHARVYTHRIEAGVIAWPTWQVIQALPEVLRKEYESLEVEAVVFYPRRFVASSGAEYDALVAGLASPGPAWEQHLDLGRKLVTTHTHLTDEYATLRLPIGRLAARAIALRAEARRESGRGSATELGMKTFANAIYGALASSKLPTQNLVGANVVTATARAAAYVLHISLNGYGVVTDGCSYRRDQLPAGTLAEVLRADADYLVRRPDDGPPCGGYLDTRSVPVSDPDFTRWYRLHAKSFFGTTAPEFDRLLSIHELEHKSVDGRPEFDGICCDGAADHVKLACAAGGYQAVEARLRGYPPDAKAAVTPWLVATYTGDAYAGPAPPATATTLLRLADAMTVARGALRHTGSSHVYFPLGVARQQHQQYRAIKLKGYTFRTPRQRATVLKAYERFAERTGTGLEVLAERRGYDGRGRGSLQAVARRVFDFVRAGRTDLTKAFNLDRVPDADRTGPDGREEARRTFWAQLASGPATGQSAGWVVSERDVQRPQPDDSESN